jgi:hypothetical protein
MAMDEAELRSFLEYLAECNDRPTASPIVLHACRTARIKYETESRREPSVGAVIDGLEQWVAVPDVIRVADIGIDPGTEAADGAGAGLRHFTREALKAKRTR